MVNIVFLSDEAWFKRYPKEVWGDCEIDPKGISNAVGIFNIKENTEYYRDKYKPVVNLNRIVYTDGETPYAFKQSFSKEE